MSDGKKNKETLLLGDMYKNLFTRIKGLIVRPRMVWEGAFAEKSSLNEVLMQFSLPLIGAYSLAILIGYLLSHQEFDLESALKYAVFIFSACFFGLYSAYFVLVKLMPVLELKGDKEIAFKLVAFSSLPIYLFGFITALFPETFFLSFLVIYSAYIVWEATGVLDKNKNKRLWQTIVITVLILLLPYAFNKLLINLSGFAL